MSSFQQGSGFRICGMVVRKFVAPSGKAAFLTLDVAGERRKKLEMRAFDSDMIAEVGSLLDGQVVEVTGSVDSEKLTDKKRNPVIVDGREKWGTALTIKAIKVEAASKRQTFNEDDAPISGPPAAAPKSTPSETWGDTSDPDF